MKSYISLYDISNLDEFVENLATAAVDSRMELAEYASQGNIAYVIRYAQGVAADQKLFSIFHKIQSMVNDDGRDIMDALAMAYFTETDYLLGNYGSHDDDAQGKDEARRAFLKWVMDGMCSMYTEGEAIRINHSTMTWHMNKIREAAKEAEDAKKAAAKAEHDAKYGAAKNAEGKTVRWQGVAAAMKRLGYTQKSAEEFSTYYVDGPHEFKVEVDDGVVLVTMNGHVANADELEHNVREKAQLDAAVEAATAAKAVLESVAGYFCQDITIGFREAYIRITGWKVEAE